MVELGLEIGTNQVFFGRFHVIFSVDLATLRSGALSHMARHLYASHVAHIRTV